MTKYRITKLSIILAMSVLLASCWPASSGMMMTGVMMRGCCGRIPGMMRSGQSLPPPEVTPAPAVTPGGPVSVSYRQDIQPILDRQCVSCHGGQAGLYLNSYDNLMFGGSGGKVVIPGEPQASELVKRIQGQSQPRMPLGADALRSSEIDRIVIWIAEGCPNN